MWITIPTRKAPNRDLSRDALLLQQMSGATLQGSRALEQLATLLTGLWLASAGFSALGVGLARVGVTCGRVPTGPPARQKVGAIWQ